MPEPTGPESSTSSRRSDWRHSLVARRLLVLFSLLSSGLAQTASTDPAERQSLEYQVKAVFLLNFTKFIEWPMLETSNPDLPFNICILGEDPFGPTLDQTVQGEKVAGHKLAVLRIQKEAAASCEILYVTKQEKDIREILTNSTQHTLTVGEGESFVKDGGIVAFVVENRHVRFYINLRAARAAGLKISSRLLSVAKSVEN